MKPPTPSLQKYPTQSSIKNRNDDNEDGKEENGVWFWVNKSGFPIDESTWDRMWDHVAKNHPGGYNMVCGIRSAKDLPQVSIPQPPYNFPVNISVADKLEKIQNYMRDLQYNHTGTQFFEIKKNRPISGLMESAREMIRESLPIKCLEAVILGIFLTNGMMGVERFAISFKSTFGSHVHRHVVLGIYYGGLYGAIGMSRREELMYKPLIYKNLSDLVLDFESNYIKFYHRLNKIKVGLPIPHDPHSFEPIPWKVINVNVAKTRRKDIVKDLDQHAREIRTKARSWSMPASVNKKMSPLIDTLGGNHLKTNQQATKSSPSS
ncbi:hypothetical protein LOTGIDRAFT_133279 [Lottia gigantea]|uniref:Vasohibin-like protein n=1 Tax=Lottia gigantea TaxID=225164 RepID=V3ZRM9_LOTGI|nr:hypothetical protein LOTGIDRAFT_133279 [Lottia gigantea]ESO83536.1 hypothetical protein LOTGIDRAFT_133279 [Lottia gigantea]